MPLVSLVSLLLQHQRESRQGQGQPHTRAALKSEVKLMLIVCQFVSNPWKCSKNNLLYTHESLRVESGQSPGFQPLMRDKQSIRNKFKIGFGVSRIGSKQA